MIFVSSGITDGVRKFLAEDRAVANWSVHVVGFYFRLAILLAGLGRSCWYSRPSSGFVGFAFGSELTIYFYVLAALVITAQFRDFGRKTLMDSVSSDTRNRSRFSTRLASSQSQSR